MYRDCPRLRVAVATICVDGLLVRSCCCCQATDIAHKLFLEAGFGHGYAFVSAQS